MPREEQYLGDIVQAASHIAGFLAGVDREAFMASELIRSAVLQKLSVIGEAANRVTPELRAAHPEISWRGIVGMRNLAAIPQAPTRRRASAAT
jgi:uncharacterized protein with HEPN domain